MQKDSFNYVLIEYEPPKTAVSPRSQGRFAARDVSPGEKSASQRQKFHTDDVSQCLHNYSGSHGVPNPDSSILCFSRSILVKFCVICERAPAEVKCFFQRRIYLKNIDRFDIDLSPLHLTFVVGEVLKEISLLRSDCSTGVDQIPVKYVKQVGDFPTGPLAHIINVCISNSQFPRIWKTARISPVPEVDHPKQDADYRPVSILLALFKVFALSVWCSSISSTILRRRRRTRRTRTRTRTRRTRRRKFFLQLAFVT